MIAFYFLSQLLIRTISFGHIHDRCSLKISLCTVFEQIIFTYGHFGYLVRITQKQYIAIWNVIFLNRCYHESQKYETKSATRSYTLIDQFLFVCILFFLTALINFFSLHAHFTNVNLQVNKSRAMLLFSWRALRQRTDKVWWSKADN